MFSIMLLGSCSKCYECREIHESTGDCPSSGINPDRTYEVCRGNLSSREMKEYIDTLEDSYIETVSNGVVCAVFTTKCRRKLF